MAYVSKEDIDWLHHHGQYGENGWVCLETGGRINAIPQGRSVHLFGAPIGFGEVRWVLHLYCIRCNPDYEPPAYGAPIQDSQLVEVTEDTLN